MGQFHKIGAIGKFRAADFRLASDMKQFFPLRGEGTHGGRLRTKRPAGAKNFLRRPRRISTKSTQEMQNEEAEAKPAGDEFRSHFQFVEAARILPGDAPTTRGAITSVS